jgi:hypothetical protein
MKFLILLIVAMLAAIVFFSFSENFRVVIGEFKTGLPAANAPQAKTGIASGTKPEQNGSEQSGTPNGNGFYGPVGKPGRGFIGPRSNPPNY